MCVDLVAELKKLTHVFVTRNATSYEDIPSECELFGTALLGSSIPISNLTFNLTVTGTFWVFVSLVFKRNVNPIGAESFCTDNKDDITLDECTRKCSSYSHFYHGGTSCICKNGTLPRLESLLGVEKCGVKRKVLCLFPNDCVVYEKVSDNKHFLCETYTYGKYDATTWWFDVERCDQRHQYSFLCSNGSLAVSYNIGNSTWYEAYQYCIDHGYNLVTNYRDIPNTYKDGKTYWVSLFRRTEFLFGEKPHDLCVAIDIAPNKTLSFVSKHCAENLRSICHVTNNETKPDSAGSTNVVLVLVFIGILITVLTVVYYFVRFQRKSGPESPKRNDKLTKKHEQVSEMKEGGIELLDRNNRQ